MVEQWHRQFSLAFSKSESISSQLKIARDIADRSCTCPRLNLRQVEEDLFSLRREMEESFRDLAVYPAILVRDVPGTKGLYTVIVFTLKGSSSNDIINVSVR
jgi:hypothetical protein